jgi:hypothetical protein
MRANRIAEDADRLEQIAKWFEQLKGQLPPAALKIVESPSDEGLPKTGEVHYHRGSAASCPPGYRRGRYYLFYGPHLWEFLQARYDEVRVSLQCAGFATKRIAGNPSEVDREIVSMRRDRRLSMRCGSGVFGVRLAFLLLLFYLLRQRRSGGICFEKCVMHHRSAR